MKYWYLASPYSKYKDGLERAFIVVCNNAGLLIAAGVPVYSPIAHTHSIAVHAGMDPFDHKIWLPADEPMMHAAHGLIVLKMQGWEESYGIGEELKIFTAAGKPIIYMEPGVIPVFS